MYGKLPEGPVFRPTPEEFSDPMKYIDKIRSIGERIGMCKIIPPENWQPPFALDVERLKFTPRVQRLNELNAPIRIKMNFLSLLAVFWEMQGSSFRVPVVEQRVLDLHLLRKLVLNNGGYRAVTEAKKWDSIVIELGDIPQKCSYIVKHHYKKIIYPYDIFEQRRERKKPKFKMNPIDDDSNSQNSMEMNSNKLSDDDQKGNKSVFVAKRGERFCKELQRLQFYGAGPKMAGFTTQYNESRKRRRVSEEELLLSKYVCKACDKKDYDESMLLCSRCEVSYHLYCLEPPLVNVPNGSWACFDCIEIELDKQSKLEPFGFSQTDHEYSLHEFGERAEKFKIEYLNRPIQEITTQLIEDEYWKILSSLDSDVTVEYGADLHTIDHGSAFPTKDSRNLGGEDLEYANSPWNLNNLPVVDGSILSYLTGNISGIKLPWMYVGMLFSSFCWHNEDHWTHSINYLHWGDPKTWYCVPGNNAEEFEETMKKEAKELFEAQPDLLQQLVTTLDPHVLVNAGVPVHRMDQYPGEFVVTFPRAYHAGFNQGYNFAEAVNFAPAEWLKMGRACIEYYSLYRRYCVFSHDELVCKMALNADQLSLPIAAVTYEDMLEMVTIEKNLRHIFWQNGIRDSVRVAFEQLADEDRQCYICNTTCFLSAVVCKCHPKRKLCLRHVKPICACRYEDFTLQYRYTMDELPHLLQNVKLKAESFDQWVGKVRDVLVDKTVIITFKYLHDLHTEAITKKFPQCDLLNILKQTVEAAEKCINYIEQLKRTPNTLTLPELKSFTDEIGRLCSLQEVNVLKQHIFAAEKFKYDATVLLAQKFDDTSVIELENCINYGSSVAIELNVMTQLKVRLNNVRWYTEIDKLINNGDRIPLESLKRWITIGSNLPSNPCVSKIVGMLISLQKRSEEWEEKFNKCFQTTSARKVLPDLRALLDTSAKIPVDIPLRDVLEDAINKISAWYTWYSIVKSAFCRSKINFTTLEKLVNQGRKLPIKLKELKPLEKDYDVACVWKKSMVEIFSNTETSVDKLMPLLCPIGYVAPPQTLIRKTIKYTEPADIKKAIKKAKHTEIDFIREERQFNSQKISQRLHVSKYCVCNRSTFGQMIQCGLCKNLFHTTCIPANLDVRYLCPSCKRTKRPPLEILYPKLAEAKKINVSMDETVALDILIVTSAGWVKNAEGLAEDKLRHKLKSRCDSNNEDKLKDVCASYLSEMLLRGDVLEVDDTKTGVRKVFDILQKFTPNEKTFYDFRGEVIDTIDLTDGVHDTDDTLTVVNGTRSLSLSEEIHSENGNMLVKLED